MKGVDTVRTRPAYCDTAVQSTAAPMTVAGRHLPELDGLRGLAVLLVMLLHFTQPQSSALMAGPTPDRLLWFIAEAGWIGVDLFFVLSGFLITGILYDSKSRPRYFHNFYARRALRILPLYYAFLIGRLVIGPQFISAWSAGPKTAQPWLWLHLSNVPIAVQQSWNATGSYLSHFWSLAVEEQFYLLWPAIVLYCSRSRLMVICVLIFPLAALTRSVLAFGFENVTATYVLLPSRIDSLAAGGLASLWLRGGHGRDSLRRASGRILSGAAAAVVGMALWQGGLRSHDPATYLVGLPLLAVFFAAAIIRIIVADGKGLLRVLVNDWLRLVGQRSYALYVFHLPLVPFVGQWVFSGFDTPVVSGSRVPGQLLYMTIAGLMSMAMALVSWHLLEKHFLRMKNRFDTNANLPSPGANNGMTTPRLPTIKDERQQHQLT